MIREKLLFLFFLFIGFTVYSQNLLPEWHRKYQAEEEWALAKVEGKYRNDSLNTTIVLEEQDGRLIGTIFSQFSEGFFVF